jgi:hypothetical protein
MNATVKILMAGYGPPTTGFSKSLKLIGDKLEAEFGPRVAIEYIWNIMDHGYKAEDILTLVENRRILCAARAQRRRQDHDLAHGGRPVAARCRLGFGARYRRTGRSRRRQADHGLGLRRADDLRQADAAGISRIRRRPVGHRSPLPNPPRANCWRSLGLEPHLHERCEGFSKGMRQKVALAGALVHDPRLIILDEPLTGLDAVSARHVKGLLKERVRAGCTVIMTTHILEVAERMADRIGVIARAGWSPKARSPNCASRTARTTPASKTCSSRWSTSRPPPHELGRGADLVCPARIRLAWREWLAMMTAGRRTRARARHHRLIVFAALMHLPAYAVIGRFADRRRRSTNPRSSSSPRLHLPGLGPDAVAGDRIGDAGVLCARRSRPDHVLAGLAGQRVFGAHRRDRAVGQSRWRCCCRRRSSTCW